MARFKTQLTEMLGISVPVVQAPIGSLTTPELVAAVSNAGALGMLSGTFASIEGLERSISRTRELTDRPFGVNFVLHFESRERVALCIDAGVELFSFFWGELDELAAEAKEAGAVVTHTVGSASEAVNAVESGADVIIAQGVEAGGHVWGKTSGLPLIPAVVDAVGSTPVVAAGGIGDGRGMAAALALGASGVWLGTRFVAATESRAHEQYRKNIEEACETDTTYSELFDGGWPGAPHRVLTTAVVNDWIAAGSPKTRRPGEGDVVATTANGQPITRYDDTPPTAGMAGDLNAIAQYCGQSAGTIHKTQPAEEIVVALVREADEAIRRTTGMIVSA